MVKRTGYQILLWLLNLVELGTTITHLSILHHPTEYRILLSTTNDWITYFLLIVNTMCAMIGYYVKSQHIDSGIIKTEIILLQHFYQSVVFIVIIPLAYYIAGINETTTIAYDLLFKFIIFVLLIKKIN